MQASESISTLDQSLARYSAAGVPLPVDLRSQIDSLIAPTGLAELQESVSAQVLVTAWRATRRARQVSDIAWIVLLDIFKARFAGHVHGLKEALQQHNMGIYRTRLEIDLQLGGRCFFAGRQLTAEGYPGEGKFLLDCAVEVLTGVAGRERRLSDGVRGGFYGQIGVASTILARYAAEPADDLQRAERFLLAAEQLGDRTEEHFAYLAEVYLRRYALTQDASELSRARQAVSSSSTTVSRRLQAVAGDVAAGSGLHQIRHGVTPGDAIASLYDAEGWYTRALDTLDASGVHDGYLRARRGHARHVLYRAEVDRFGRRRTTLLNEALTDLLDPDVEIHLPPSVIANALLDRARLRRRRNDPGAVADLARVRELLGGEDLSHSTAQVETLELDHAIFDAVARRDVQLVAELVARVLRLSADTALPASALAHAAKMLAAELPADEWRPILREVPDRLDSDLDHPALTPAARRHVAGHAALISWLLTRNDPQVDGLRQTAELYSQSFAAVDTTPSVDALANAGTCGLLLARHLLRGDEAAGEEAAELLAGAISWLTAAVQRVGGDVTSFPGIDLRLLNLRLGEAALRAYPLRHEPSLLVTAIDHLQLAQSHGDDSAEVNGLIGDAYYRRGISESSIDDLMRALELKETALQSGHSSRENRSVSAAAAMQAFRLGGDVALLSVAAQRALQAAAVASDWPWAVLQLADVARDHTLLDRDLVLAEAPHDLAQAVVNGERAALLQRAAELAVSNNEFESSVLGGQKREGEQGVFVLNDAHRLVEQAIVLKRLPYDEALQEFEWTKELRIWLTARRVAPMWVLPEPLGIVTGVGVAPGQGVYVMRRRQGRPLGAFVIDSFRSGGEASAHLHKFEQALAYLAAYQTWRLETDPAGARQAPAEEETLPAVVARSSRRLGLPAAAHEALIACIEPYLTPEYPLLPKKDPHPANWLWTPKDDLVLIDVETSGALPALYEAAALLDDLPLLAVTAEQWQTRETLCRRYLDDVLPGMPLQVGGYEAFIAVRCVAGISPCAEMSPRAPRFRPTTGACSMITTWRCCAGLPHTRGPARSGWLPGWPPRNYRQPADQTEGAQRRVHLPH